MVWQLYVKELKGQKGSFLLLPGIQLAWLTFLYSRLGHWPSEVVGGLAWLPVSFLPLWAVWKGVQLYRQEWSENTSYLMLSLPIQGWKVSVSKLAALLTELVGYTALVILGGVWMLKITGMLSELEQMIKLAGYGWMIDAGIKMLFGVLLGLTSLGTLAQAAVLISRLVDRFQGLTLALTLLVGLWAMKQFSVIVGSLLIFLPRIYMQAPIQVNGIVEMRTVSIESGPVAAALLFCGLLVWAIGWLLDRVVEV